VIIDLGCGTRRQPGAVGVDSNPAVEPDVVHDLNRRPYPFEESVADEVYLDNVLEHLDDVIGTLEEVHRILRPNGTVRIDVPYFRSRWAAIDPTHRNAFGVESFSYFDPSHAFFERYSYTSARFEVVRVAFNERWPARGVRARVARYATRKPVAYEVRFSHLFPLDELTVVLRALKPSLS
jgi:SAM-dependent methyltransferase